MTRGQWNSILSALLSASKGYLVGFTNFAYEISKLISSKPLQTRTVLVIEIKNSQHWQAGIPSLEKRINRLADAAWKCNLKGVH